MILTETKLTGAFLVDPDLREDVRGSFTTLFAAAEFTARGLAGEVAQTAICFNARRATLRGMHYQAAPHEQAKLVRCTRGRVYDVILDLREASPTLGQWMAIPLASASPRMVYIPPGLAHGYLTLEDDSEMLYHLSRPHAPDAERGVRWNDAAFGIDWPEAPQVISQRDSRFADWCPEKG